MLCVWSLSAQAVLRLPHDMITAFGKHSENTFISVSFRLAKNWCSLFGRDLRALFNADSDLSRPAILIKRSWRYSLDNLSRDIKFTPFRSENSQSFLAVFNVNITLFSTRLQKSVSSALFEFLHREESLLQIRRISNWKNKWPPY